MVPEKLDRLQQLHLQAQAHWPNLFVPYQRFRERLQSASVDPERLALEDVFLALGIESGSPAALQLFHQKYHKLLCYIAGRILKDPELVDDMVQDFLLVLPREIRTYKGIGTLQGWLGVVVANYARRHARKSGRQVSLEQLTDPDSERAFTRDVTSDGGESAERIREDLDRAHCEELFAEILPQALDSLCPKWRTLIEYKYYHGLTSREIGRVFLHAKEYSVSKWLRKALDQLRKRLLRLASAKPRVTREEFRDCIELMLRLR